MKYPNVNDKSAPPMNYGQPPPHAPQHSHPTPPLYGHPPPQQHAHQPPPPPPPPPPQYARPPPPQYARPPPPPPMMGAPVATPTAPGRKGPWSTGLCDCTSDCSSCCMTCWCPCVTFGRVAEILDKGSTTCGVSGTVYTLIALLTGCTCLYSCCYRQKMRKLYSLPGGSCDDCLVHCFCEKCALCQEYRELKNRGFDMTLGWHGNVKRNQGVAMGAPYAQGGMKR